MPRKKKVPNMPCAFISEETADYGFEENCNKEKYYNSRAPRNAANARERARMRVLSKAFCKLKTTLPWVPADTKLSKLDTLRLAATYIAHLRAILYNDENNRSEITKSISLTVSWPFVVQNVSLPILNNDNNDTLTTEADRRKNNCLLEHSSKK